MEKQHPILGLMQTTMEKIREIIDANTIVGQPITTPDGIMLIPVSKVSLGFGSGGSDFTGKNQSADKDNPFGGGGGAGVNIAPVAFIVVNGDSVKLLPIAEQSSSSSIDKILELVPELIEKIPALKKKDKAKE